MTTVGRRRLLPAASWLAAVMSMQAATLVAQQETAATKPVRILFIGNSYTYSNDLPAMLQAMALAAPQPITIDAGTVLVGGATLRDHWDGDARNAIRRGDWDYVVLQEQSLRPIDATREFIEYGRRLGEEIRAVKARPVLYLTWARKSRPSSQEALNRGYLRLADEIGAIVVPVGPAWSEFRRLDGTSELYTEDGSHPSALGSLLAASMFFRTLFGVLPPETYGPDSTIAPRVLPLVRRAVQETASSFPARQNP
jgi:hypothetical protein